MEALVQIAMAIVAFVFEVTIHALVFIYLLLRAAFSPSYREKLRDHWNTSNWKRVSIITGIGLYSVALIFALCVWIPILFTESRDHAENDSRRGNTIQIQLTSEEIEAIEETKEIGELIDTAGEIFKRKMEERKKAEQNGVE